MGPDSLRGRDHYLLGKRGRYLTGPDSLEVGEVVNEIDDRYVLASHLSFCYLRLIVSRKIVIRGYF